MASGSESYSRYNSKRKGKAAAGAIARVTAAQKRKPKRGQFSGEKGSDVPF